MKTLPCLVCVALFVGGASPLAAQSATPQQIEAAQQILRGGSSTQTSARKHVYVRTNNAVGPTRLAVARTIPSVTHTPEGAMTQDMEDIARAILRQTLAEPHLYAAPAPAPLVPAGPVAAAPAAAASGPASTAGAVSSGPAAYVAPAAAVPADKPRDSEEAARRLLERNRLNPAEQRAEALRIEEEIRRVKAAQEANGPSASSQLEDERMKEIARIEAEVLKAKARREKELQNNPPPAFVPATEPPAEPAPAPPPPPSEPESSDTGSAGETSALEMSLPVTTAAVQGVMSQEQEGEARAILERMMSEMDSSAPAGGTTGTFAAPATERAASGPALPTAEAASQASSAQTTPSAAPVAPPAPAAPKPAPSAAPAAPSVQPGGGASGSVLTYGGSREQRLADLLEAYKADRITPAQYHQERARILAEP